MPTSSRYQYTENAQNILGIFRFLLVKTSLAL